MKKFALWVVLALLIPLQASAAVKWEEGKPQVCKVMHHIHEAFNLSNKPLEILFVDVKLGAEVVINR